MADRSHGQATENSPTYVIDRWWHRLFKVIIFLGVVLVAAIGTLRIFDYARYPTYIYSFQEGYSGTEPLPTESTMGPLEFILPRKEEPPPPPPEFIHDLGLVGKAGTRYALASRCWVREYSVTNCGDIHTPEEFLKKYLETNELKLSSTETKKIVQARNSFVAEARKDGYSDFEITKWIMEKEPINYKQYFALTRNDCSSELRTPY